MAAVYEFPNKISCNQAISWSPDHRICFCTDTAMKIMNINCGVNNIDNKIKCQQASFPVITDILDIPKFTDSQHMFLIQNLCREDLKELSVDRVLNPLKYQFESVARNGFAAAAWSPLGGDAVGRSLLATLSQDYRLCLYSHEPSHNEWLQLVDLSVLSCEQARPKLDLKSVNDYHKHRIWCYTQAVTVMKWCNKVYTDTETGQKYMLLATGMKSGHFVMWRINTPNPKKSDCSILFTIKPYDCQISGLLWCHSDAVFVGYFDGQIHVIKLDTQDVKEEPTCKCLYAESDLMKVSSMCMLDKVKTGVYVLLANKEHCLLAFVLDVHNYNVISQSHTFLQNTLSSSGMFEMSEDTVFMMSQDAILQRIRVTVNQNGLELSAVQVNLDLSTSTTWVSPGFYLSPNKALVAFIARPKPGFDHLSPQWKKSATKVNIKCIDDFSNDSKVRENCFTKLCNSDSSFGSQRDVLELYRHNVLSTGLKTDSKEIDIVDETGKLCRKRLKLKRYWKMLKHRYYTQREEDQDEIIKDLDQQVLDLTSKIQAMYVQQCLARCDLEKVLAESNKDKSIFILYSMHSWLNQNSDRICDVEGITEIKQLLESALKDRKCEIKCYVCNFDLKMNNSRWFCDNGHLFDVCCRSLIPVDGVDYKTCVTCYVTASSPEILAGVDWLPSDFNTCLFCEELMLP